MKLLSVLQYLFYNFPYLFIPIFAFVELTVVLIIGTVFFPLEPIEDDDSEYEIDDSDEDEEGEFEVLNLRAVLLSIPIVQCIRRVYLPTRSLLINSIGQIAIHAISIMIAINVHEFLEVAIQSFFWGIKIKNHRYYSDMFDGIEI